MIKSRHYLIRSFSEKCSTSGVSNPGFGQSTAIEDEHPEDAGGESFMIDLQKTWKTSSAVKKR